MHDFLSSYLSFENCLHTFQQLPDTRISLPLEEHHQKWAEDLCNEAERALRMMKVRLNIYVCFRTLTGARRHARMRSHITTLREHGLPAVENRRRALDGRSFLPDDSSMT